MTRLRPAASLSAPMALPAAAFQLAPRFKAFGERIAAVRQCRSDEWRSNGSPPTA